MSGLVGPRYRLRGDVGGVAKSFLVPAGETLVGSVRDNGIVLPVRGVSRHHARLAFGPEGLSVHDLESRNGVAVNGVRVRTAALWPGDELRLGPVALRVEEIPKDDARLAIAVDPSSPRGSGLPSWETTAVTGAAGGTGWLTLLDSFFERLCVVPEPDLDGACEQLRRHGDGRGAALLEWGDGDAVVLAAAGEVPDVVGDARLEALWRKAAGREGVASSSSDEVPPVAGAVMTRAGGASLALVVWGGRGSGPDLEPLLRSLLRLTERFRPRPARPLQERPPVAVQGIVFPEGYVAAGSAAMASLHAQMRPLLHGDLPVLILGETGVGKELIARILHASSSRSKGPFVAVNCAAIPSDLLEAEMFGIGKGVATGVVERPGKFQLARGGTLFLDEIGDMPLGLQAKLLRALQEKEVQPVGSAPVSVDLRVLAASNSDLLQRAEDGRFRRDLYYRVAGYVLRVPPLRERREDVPALVEGFLRSFAGETGKAIRGITVRALALLAGYDWPGNVRELEHEVRRLVYLCGEGEAIDASMLSPHLFAPVTGSTPAASADASLDLAAHVEALETRLVQEALARAGGNKSQAAKLLGISRNGLAIKMQRLSIPD